MPRISLPPKAHFKAGVEAIRTAQARREGKVRKRIKHWKHLAGAGVEEAVDVADKIRKGMPPKQHFTEGVKAVKELVRGGSRRRKPTPSKASRKLYEPFGPPV